MIAMFRYIVVYSHGSRVIPHGQRHLAIEQARAFGGVVYDSWSKVKGQFRVVKNCTR